MLRVQACRGLVLDLRPRDNVTLALIDLYWLLVTARIEYKLRIVVYRSIVVDGRHTSDMLQPVSGLDWQTARQHGNKFRHIYI